MTLYEFIKTRNGNGIDISDTIFDYLNYFECFVGNKEEKKSLDDYDKVMIFLAKHIEVEQHLPYQTESAICKIADFIESNRQLFDEFLNEVLLDRYAPKNNPPIKKETDEFYDLYMIAFSDLINGNFATSDYTIFMQKVEALSKPKNVTRQELQEKLNALLLNTSACYNYDISEKVRKQLDEWFNNSQCYFSMRCENYTFTICYKNVSMIIFDVKKKADPVHKWIIKDIIIKDDFIDTETSIKAVKQRLAEWREKRYEQEKEGWGDVSYSFDELTELLKVAKEHFPNKSNNDLNNMFYALNFRYYQHEEALCESEDK